MKHLLSLSIISLYTLLAACDDPPAPPPEALSGPLNGLQSERPVELTNDDDFRDVLNIDTILAVQNTNRENVSYFEPSIVLGGSSTVPPIYYVSSLGSTEEENDEEENDPGSGLLIRAEGSAYRIFVIEANDIFDVMKLRYPTRIDNQQDANDDDGNQDSASYFEVWGVGDEWEPIDFTAVPPPSSETPNFVTFSAGSTKIPEAQVIGNKVYYRITLLNAINPVFDFEGPASLFNFYIGE